MHIKIFEATLICRWLKSAGAARNLGSDPRLIPAHGRVVSWILLMKTAQNSFVAMEQCTLGVSFNIPPITHSLHSDLNFFLHLVLPCREINEIKWKGDAWRKAGLSR